MNDEADVRQLLREIRDRVGDLEVVVAVEAEVLDRDLGGAIVQSRRAVEVGVGHVVAERVEDELGDDGGIPAPGRFTGRR